jgi:endonuclease YncB( thermonuclease family)
MNSAKTFLLFLFVLLPFSSFSFAAEVKTYDQLVHAIREARTASQARIDEAINQEKVRGAWETGKLIDEHVLQHKERADYGEQVIHRLSKDLGNSETELRFMVRFFRAYPIQWPATELTWSHYQALLGLEDQKDREEFTQKALKENWGRDRLREEVRKRKSYKEAAPEKPLTAEPGEVYTYRVVKAVVGPFKGQLVVDLGFSNYHQPAGLEKFKDGELVKFEDGKLRKTEGEEKLFTYNVYVTQVLDGDTFKAVVDLGFKIMTVQTLRLRGLDAPEIESKEGREAKAFFEKRLRKSPVLIRTVKSDKYDRYLADVFVGGKYVNQQLLDKNLAERMSG